MKIAEIFQSIHGEVNGHHQGRICTFIRFSGCNLKCHYCFGVRPGRRKPRIITSQGSNVKLPEVSKGLKLLTFDSGMSLVETEITNVEEREVYQWYQITVEGTQYCVTPDHPFFTNKGLITTENLKIGDEILHASFKDKISFSKRGELNPMKNPETAQKRKNNTDYIKLGKKISKTIKKKQENGLYISPWTKLSEDQKEIIKQNSAKRMKGELNPNWKGGINCNYNYLKQKIKKGEITLCGMSYCVNSTDLHVHHIDGDINNDDWENLQVICRSCHSIIHENGYSFWEHRQEKLSSDSKTKLKNRLKATGRNGMTVEAIKFFDVYSKSPSIRPKPLKVYTISCEPYNSYLVDYMWVHNCDTPQTQDPNSGTEMSVKEIIQEVKKLKSPYICLTGGEPFCQNEKEMNSLLYNLSDYKISCETNGTKNLKPFAYHISSIVMDYKIGIKNFVYDEKNYKYLTDNDVIKFVIGTENELNLAIRKYFHFHDLFWNKQFLPMFAFSTYKPKYFTPKMIFEQLIKNKVYNSIISLQLHKLTGFQ